jgi:hypothetical protein
MQLGQGPVAARLSRVGAMAAVELRPLGIGELLDVAIRLTVRNAGTLLRAVVVVVLPLQVISAIVYVSGSDDQFRNVNGKVTLGSGTSAGTFAATFAIVLLISWLTPLIASGVCFKAVGDAYLGGSPSWRESLRFTLGRVHSIAWISILVALGSFAGAILCLLPGIWLFISWAIALPVLMTENARGTKALRRSFGLIKGRWWATFGALVLAYILSAVVGGGISALLSAASLSGSGHSTLVDIVLRIVSGSISDFLTVPFVAALTVVLYLDLRVRKEGFDVQMLAAQIGLAPGEVPVVPVPPTGPLGTPGQPLWGPRSAQGAGSAQPPFWPPPPGWRPPEPEPAAETEPPGTTPTATPTVEEPPFWPPPPGWRPRDPE